MSVTSATAMAIALLIGFAASTQPSFAGRPSWMPSAPPLPLTGRPVRVSTAGELMAAVREARDADTILIADGTYELPTFLHLAGKSDVTVRSTSGDPTKVALRGSGFASESKQDDILRIQGCADITIAYLTFEEAHAYGIKLENLLLDGRGLRNISIYGCRFFNIGTRMIKGTGGDRQPVDVGSIRYCYFENSKIPPSTWIFQGDYVSAIDCMRLKDWVISDNYFSNIRGANGGGRGAVFVWVESENVMSERNVFVNCDRSICYGNPSGSSETPARPHNTGGVIRNNFIVAGADKGIEVCWASGVKVYHNTVLTPDPDRGRGIHCHWRELTRIHIANNLVRGRIYGDEDGITKEGNLTQGIADHWFRNVAEGDLHLTAAATAAIDQADPVPGCSTDFDGDPRPAARGQADLGADEQEPEV